MSFFNRALGSVTHQGRSRRRATAMAATAMALVLLTGTLASADELIVDGDGLVPVASNSINLGEICIGQTASGTALLAIKRNETGNGNIFDNTQVVLVSATPSSSNVSVSFTDSGIGIPLGWSTSDPNTMTTDTASSLISVTAVALTAPQTNPRSATVNYKASGQKLGAPATAALMERFATLAVVWTVKNCTPADTTAPTASPSANPAANGAGWNTSDVTVTWNWADAGGFVVSATNCPASSATTGEGTNVSVSATCVDKAGNSATATRSVKVDTIAPTAAAPSASPDAEWNGSNVKVTWNWADAGSGLNLALCPLTSTSAGEGVIELTASCTDMAGNVGSAAKTVKVDKTAPVVLASPSPPANPAGWNKTDVTVTYSSTDGGSPITCDPATVLSAEGTGLSATGACTDAAGNTSSATASGIKIDKTAPVVVATSSPGPNIAGWNNTDVTVTYSSAADGGSLITCGPTTVLSADGFEQTAAGTCTDEAGNIGTASKMVSVDTIAPTAAAEALPAANGAGWNTSDVTVAWNWADAGSGLNDGTCPTNSASSGEGVIELIATCTDIAENTGSAVKTVKVDKVAPAAAPSASSDAEWNGSDVMVTWNWADAGSGLNPTLCPATSKSTGEGVIELTASCTDIAGNIGSATKVVKVDKTAPVVVATPSPAANAGWNNTNVTVTYSNAPDSGSPVTCDPFTVLSAEGTGLSATGACTDAAGNTSSATASGIKIDKIAPVVAIVGPANGGSYYFGSVPPATCTASDVLSGLPEGPACKLPALGTSVGGHTVSATATDLAGNSTTVTVTYTVLKWTPTGFYRPVDMGDPEAGIITWNSVKAGSTVPLKFQVFAGSTELTTTSVVSGTVPVLVSCGPGNIDGVEEIAAPGSTVLRYDTDGRQFIFNWKTPKNMNKCYRVTLNLQDGSSIVANFKLT